MLCNVPGRRLVHSKFNSEEPGYRIDLERVALAVTRGGCHKGYSQKLFEPKVKLDKCFL